MIKIIASDLDGTFLNAKKEITLRLSAILEKAHEKGAILLPATGRPLFSIPPAVMEIPSAKYIIASNGASVYRRGDKKPIISNCLNPYTSEKIFNMSSGLDIITEIFIDGQAYISRAHLKSLENAGFSQTRINYIKSTRISVDDLYIILKENINKIENINLIFQSMSLRENFRVNINKSIDACVTTSSPDNIEIGSPKATKGSALRELAQMLNIDRENIIAFGDNENDMDMLKFAGTGVIMENADSSLKSGADIVAPSCDNFGVAAILEKYI